MEIFSDASLRRGLRIAGLTAVLGTLAACGGGGGGGSTSGTSQPPPEGSTGDTATPGTLSLFALGEEQGASSELVVYASGFVNGDNTPLTADDFANLTVKIDGTAVEGTSVNIEPVTDANAPAASATFLTDYSHSMMQASIDEDDHLKKIGDVYQGLLDSLPGDNTKYSAEVLDFSDVVRLRTAYTDAQRGFVEGTALDPQAMAFFQDSTGADAEFARSTALYKAIDTATGGGEARNGGSGQEITNKVNIDGLDDRCSPVRMMVVYADGENNVSYSKDKTQLVQQIQDRAIFPVMLASRLEASSATGVDNVREKVLESWGGYFAYQQGTQKLQTTLANELESALGNMVKISISGAVTTGQTVEISLPKENGHEAAATQIKVRDFTHTCK